MFYILKKKLIADGNHKSFATRKPLLIIKHQPSGVSPVHMVVGTEGHIYKPYISSGIRYDGDDHNDIARMSNKPTIFFTTCSGCLKVPVHFL